jgi:hypothetical protein
MKANKFSVQSGVVLLFILATAALRVVFNFSDGLSTMANFSPLGAMALFGGACFNSRWKAALLPVGTLFLSDVILQQTIYAKYSNGLLYGGWMWVYGAFLLMVIAGRLILRQLMASHFILSVIVTVLIHWLVTDFGVWMGSKVYAQNLGGYINCLIVAIPFELRFLTGTLVYGAVLCGGISLLQGRKSGVPVN